jgi:hypothetical protein
VLARAASYVAMGVVIAAGPSFVHPSSGWRLGWYLTAAFFGLLGLGPGLAQLGRLTGHHVVGAASTPVFLGGIAGVLYTFVAAEVVHGAAQHVLRIVIIVLLAMAVGVFGDQVGRALSETATDRSGTSPVSMSTEPSTPRIERASGTSVERILGLLVALVGLATAVLSFLAAGRTH